MPFLWPKVSSQIIVSHETFTSAWSLSIGIQSPGPHKSDKTVATDDTTSFSSNWRSCWLSASLSIRCLPSPFLSATNHIKRFKTMQAKVVTMHWVSVNPITQTTSNALCSWISRIYQCKTTFSLSSTNLSIFYRIILCSDHESLDA